jgi:hypothetical protein
MTKQEEMRLVAAHKKNPAAKRIVLSKMAGVTEGVARRFLSDMAAGKPVKTDDGKPSTVAVKKGKTLADFRNTYDLSTIVPKKIKEGIKSLGNSGWEYEVEFARMANVRLIDVANFRELFVDYIVNLKDNRRVWAGSVQTAKTMRAML